MFHGAAGGCFLIARLLDLSLVAHGCYAPAQGLANAWRFQSSVVFGRLDVYIQRCHDMLDFSTAALQFSKLERVEVGGTRGRVITQVGRARGGGGGAPLQTQGGGWSTFEQGPRT